jgi:TatD DNase family protein
MPSDAHCHIFDLAKFSDISNMKERCRSLKVAASAWNRKEFEFHEQFAQNVMKKTGGAAIIKCFAVHPQLPTVDPNEVETSLETMHILADETRLQAIGETGFDLFNDFHNYRLTEAVQDELFITHLELAVAKQLPLVLHIRRAMHKVFAYSNLLKKVPSVIFHSYSGTFEDGQNLLKRGINAYFSFGTTILLNHKTAQSACARIPLDRLLSETDAPYQPLRGEAFSHWGNLPDIVQGMLRLRGEANIEELTEKIEKNFQRAYNVPAVLPHSLTRPGTGSTAC